MHLQSSESKSESAAHWDRIAKEWRVRVAISKDRVGQLLEQLACPPGSFLLDAGCGTGRISVAFALEGYHVHGFDLSPEMIAEAGDYAREHGVSEKFARFSVGDVERITYPDEVFDGLVCCNVLDFVSAPGMALVELRRVVKPGGRLILSMLGARSPVKQDYWQRFLPESTIPCTIGSILPWEMEALLTGTGWEILAQQPRFGPAFSGVTNNYNEEACETFRDRVLQQTIASVWEFVVRKR